MSQPVTRGSQADVPDTLVRNRSQWAKKLHRPDPDAEDVRPACPEADCRPDARFTAVSVLAYPTYGLCDNPECFGSEWW